MKGPKNVAGRIITTVLGVMLLVVVVSACRSAPPYQGLDADGVFEVGAQAFEEEDWDDARDALEHFLTTHAGHGRAAEARMLLARTYFERGDHLSAADEFQRFLQLHPSHGLAPEASLGICRSYVELAPHPQRDQQYTERARDACRNTRNEFEGMNVAEEAEELRARMTNRLAEREYQIGRFYQRRGAHDSAILIFQDLVDFFPESDWAPRGFLALYRSYRAIRWDEEAEEVRDRLLFLYPDSEAAQELRAEDDGP